MIRVERFVETDSDAAFEVVVVRPAVRADTAGWRKWCEENPEKCGGNRPRARKITAKQALELKALTEKVSWASSPEAHAAALVALGARAQELGVWSRAKAHEEWNASREKVFAADVAAMERSLELRNMPGSTIDEMPLLRDFEAQVLAHDEEYQRLNKAADKAAADHDATRKAIGDPSEMVKSLERVGVVFGPGDRDAGPEMRGMVDPTKDPTDPDSADFKGRAAFAAAKETVPRAWLERISSTTVKPSVDPIRGFYSGNNDQINVTVNAVSGREEMTDTFRHEMMHALEVHDGGTVSKAERYLLTKRTGVDPESYDVIDRVRQINDLFTEGAGGSFDSTEYAVDGGFKHPYTGKLYMDPYSDQPGTSGHYEVLSTGMQGLFSRRYSEYDRFIDGDREFEQWLIGNIVASAY